jgi:peptidyl-prolyl cis-trans isomerase B (cyclophilin B)
MPKTASKRAQARKEAKVYRAHQTPTDRSTDRRVPPSGGRRPATKTGSRGILRDYPWAITMFVLLLVGLTVLVAHQQRLGPWAPPAPPSQARCNTSTHICNKTPLNVLMANKTYTATIKTSKGDIVIALDTKSSPSFANSFVFLAENGFYNGLAFWKVERLNQISPETNQISNIDLIQGGKGGDAQGGPGYMLKPQSAKGTYTLGVVAMANPSQFFINTADNSQAITSTSYPSIGMVNSGLNVAKAITRGDKIISITITSKTVVPTPTAAATSTPTVAATSTPTAAATPSSPATATP